MQQFYFNDQKDYCIKTFLHYIEDTLKQLIMYVKTKYILKLKVWKKHTTIFFYFIGHQRNYWKLCS